MVTWSPSWAGRATSTSSPEVDSQTVDLRVDLLLGDLQVRQCHHQSLIAGDGDGGPDHAPRRRTRPAPESSPEVMSISGWSMGSTSVSVTAWA